MKPGTATRAKRLGGGGVKTNTVPTKANPKTKAVQRSFFPENRKEHRKTGKVLYSGKDIRTTEGMSLFRDDCHRTWVYLPSRTYETWYDDSGLARQRAARLKRHIRARTSLGHAARCLESCAISPTVASQEPAVKKPGRPGQMVESRSEAESVSVLG